MKRFVTVLVGLALAMTARPAATKELPPAEAVTGLPPSPHATSLATGKHVELHSVDLLELTGTSASCDDDGVLDTGERAHVHVTLRNSGTERLEQTSMTLSSTDPDVSFPEGQTVSFPATEPGELISQELPVKLSGSSTQRQVALKIAYRDEEQLEPEDKTHTVSYQVNTDELPSTLETVEALHHPWLITSIPENSPSWTRQSTGTDGFFHGPDNGAKADLMLASPPLEVSKTETFRVIFQHRYDFEANSVITYDGAVIELSEDDGGTWVDIGTSVTPTYNTTIYPDGDNPLKGQRAYGGKSFGHPEFIKATVNLGTRYAGKTVRIRFRMGTDDSSIVKGSWDLDDLQLAGVVNKPFTAVVSHRGLCLNRAPEASVKPVAAVDEGTRVTLQGSASDVNANTTFIYTWTQGAGPSVPLSNSASAAPTFTAPLVDSDTELTFQLVVGDGELESEPATVKVLVRNVPNKPPVARAGRHQAVSEGSGVLLNGSESMDPEGLDLLYTWTQVEGEGPTVKLIPAGPKAMFNAPEVDEETTLTFRLQVTDVEKESSVATITVRVSNKVPLPPDSGGCAAGPEGGVPTVTLLLLSALCFGVRRPRGRSL